MVVLCQSTFSLKDPLWRRSWEGFYEGMVLFLDPKPLTPGEWDSGLTVKSRKLEESQVRQVLLRWEASPLFEAWLGTLQSPVPPNPSQHFLQCFLPLVGEKGAAILTHGGWLMLLFPLPDGFGPELYTSQCQQFFHELWPDHSIPHPTPLVRLRGISDAEKELW